MNLRILAETASTVTVGWDAVQSVGFDFLVDGRRVSFTHDGTRTSVKFGKPDAGKHSYEVQVLSHGDSGEIIVPAPPPPPPTAAVIVSPLGNDTTGDGSILKPFLTHARAQKAMRLGGPQTCLSRGGTHKVPVSETISGTTFGLRCTSQDSGQTYMPFENEKPLLDCSAVKNGFVADGSSHVTFDGLEAFGFLVIGFGIHGGGPFYSLFPTNVGPAAGNTVVRCEGRNGSTLTPSDFGYGGSPLFARGNIPASTLRDNAFHHCPKAGMNVAAGDAPGSSMMHFLDDLAIDGNAVHDVCTTENDAGGIYVQDTSASALRGGIFDNFVRDCAGARCIYLDDGTSNFEIASNIMAGIFDLATTVHGGRMNRWHDNLIDACALTSQNGPTTFYFRGSNIPTDHAGVEFTNHIVIARGHPHAWIDFPVVCKDNLYWGYKGGVISTSPDTNPVKADPLLSGPLYTLDPASPAFKAPINFQPLPTHWGPPGYVIPAGTSPSYA